MWTPTMRQGHKSIVETSDAVIVITVWFLRVHQDRIKLERILQDHSEIEAVTCLSEEFKPCSRNSR